MSYTKKAKDVSDVVFGENVANDIEKLAQNVEGYFFNDFGKLISKRQGGIKHVLADKYGLDTLGVNTSPSNTDLDALTHYYGQALSQKKYGTMPTLVAGLFHELRGLKRGYGYKSGIIDILNNLSSLSPDITGEQEKYKTILDSLMNSSNTKVSDEDLIGLINHGLKWTANPPERLHSGNR